MSELKADNDLVDVALVWTGLSFRGRSMLGTKSKLILNNISGYIAFGSLFGLLGPSGSGKSTFLKCLNGQNGGGLTPETEIHVSKSKTVRPCFVEQDVGDHLLNGLTASQTLLYASRLKNSGEDYKVDHQNNIRKLMKDLLISDTADTRISRCSGGEQKRIAIAAELTAIRMPNLLCVDEPTSGLDSNAAEIVVKCLKTIAEKHHISIVTSIHQPNADLLLLFDRVYVLSSGGKCVFFGPPKQIRQCLNECEIKCGDSDVPIEVMIKCASKGHKNSDVIEMIDKNYSQNKHTINRYKVECELTEHGVRVNRTGFRVRNVFTLFCRSLVNKVKSEWIAMLGQFTVSLFVAVFLSLIGNTSVGEISGCVAVTTPVNETGIESSDTCLTGTRALDNEKLLNQNITLIFLLISVLQFIQVVVTAMTFHTEIKIFFSEHRNGWYSTSSYYWAKSLVELPLPVVTGVAFVAIVFYLTNQLADSFRLLGVTVFMVAGVLCLQGVGFVFGILFDNNMPLGVACAILVFLISMFFSDFFVPLSRLHRALQFASNLSFLKLAFFSSLIYLYGFDRCPPATVSWTLRLFDIDGDERTQLYSNYVYMFANIVVFRCLILFVLIRKANPRLSY